MSLVHAYGSGSSDDDSEVEENVPQDRPKPTCSTKTTSNSFPSVGIGSTSSASTECYIGEDNNKSKPIPRSDATFQSLFKNLPKPKHNIIIKSIDEEGQANKSVSASLFSSLPVPKSSKHVGLGLGLFEFETDEKSAVPLKKTVKITVPSLSEFKDKDEGEPVKKKNKPASSGSGLFSLLPAPKNITIKERKRSLVPHVLTKKPVATVTADAKPGPSLNPAPHSLKSIHPQKPVPLINYEDSGEDSDEDDEKQDFFSLHSDKNYSLSTIHDPINTEKNILTAKPISDEECVEVSDTQPTDEISNDQPLSFVSGFQPSPWANNQPHVGTSWDNLAHAGTSSTVTASEQSTSQECSEVSDYISVVEDDIQLDEEALQRLCGRRAKTEQMEFINVNGSEIMPDPKEWLVKQLSQEQPKMRSHSHKKNDGPTTQQRRKHQITYLAFQAKENELELKNQWSQNRMSRKQTQSKYGF